MKRYPLVAWFATLCMVTASIFSSGAGIASASAASGPLAAPAASAPSAPAAVGCGMNFTDVPTTSWFYQHVEYLYCSHVVSGYGTEFRPYAQTTRGQLAKMLSVALQWPLNYSGSPHFADVSATNTFYQYIEAAYAHNIISGYACGGAGEPCDGANRPYFRPGANVTRSQLAKMIILAHSWNPQNPAQPTFTDVPSNAWFYGYVEAASSQGVIGGYADGSFKPFAPATRAQLAKMLYNTLAPPSFDQSDNESELEAADDSTEAIPQDLNPGVDGGPGMAVPGEISVKAAAPATATISGTISSTNTGTGLSGATVNAHPVGGGTTISTTTDANGNYSLTLPAGSYEIAAADLSALYPVTRNPTNPVTVQDGGSLTVSFGLTEGGVIAGTVADSTSGLPIEGANEWAVPQVLPPRAYGGSLSDAQGQYRIVVPAGVLAAWAEKNSDTYPRTPSVGGTTITVTVGMTTTSNFALAHGGVIAGHITDAATSAPLPGSRVWARHELESIAFGGPLTDAQGYYRLVVPGGTTYNVHALNIDGLYPRKPYSDNPVSVSTGMTVTADISLTKGGLITGVISAADTGNPLAGARAIAHQEVEHRYWSQWTESDGVYKIVVPAGAWNVYGRSDQQGYYRTPAASNPITVTVGTTVTANISVQRGALFQGTITDAATNAPLPYSHVWANPPGPGGPIYGIPYTDFAGRYWLAVPAGVWGVYSRNDEDGYPRTAFPGNYITATLGMTYTADIAMTMGAIIHGRLTDATTGLPIPEAQIWARAPGGGLGYGWPRTGDDGHYVLSVPAGTWRLAARDLEDLYPRTPYPGNPITATVGANITASWTMTKGGLITGQITDAHTGLPLPNALVWARSTDGNVHDADYLLDPNGTYRLVVPAGDYRLRASDIREGYPSLAYPNNPVHVTVGGVTLASWALIRW
ncbi:MAG: carboxypeptidase regulatory-like domain-containing protein [Chloroflexia bacterium]